MSHLLDLDELSLRCRDPIGRGLFDEAIGCYRIGAFRACVVATWIAVCFDLFRKFRDLANLGDARAAELVAKIDRYQHQIREGNQQGYVSALNFERGIIETALDIEVLDQSAATDLKRLQEDRNTCAHPNFERLVFPLSISAEQARVHLHNAVRHVLGEAPVQGRAALAQLRELVASDSFPKRKSEIERVIRSSALRRASDALVRGCVDMLIHETAAGTSDWSDSMTVNVLDCLFKMYPGTAEQRFREGLGKALANARDVNYESVAFLAVRVPQAWSAVEDGERARIAAFIEQSDFERARDLIRFGSDKVHLWGAISDRLSRCSLKELKELVALRPHHSLLVTEIVNRYCAVKKWDDANTIAHDLIIPAAPSLKEKHVESILKRAGSGEADIRGSYRFPEFLRSIVNAKVMSVDELSVMLGRCGLEKYVDELAIEKFEAELDDDIPF